MIAIAIHTVTSRVCESLHPSHCWHCDKASWHKHAAQINTWEAFSVKKRRKVPGRWLIVDKNSPVHSPDRTLSRWLLAAYWRTFGEISTHVWLYTPSLSFAALISAPRAESSFYPQYFTWSPPAALCSGVVCSAACWAALKTQVSPAGPLWPAHTHTQL